jgi:hypothetical protein
VAGRSAVAGPGPPRRRGRSSSCRVPPLTAPAFQHRSQRRALDPRRAPSPFPVPLFGRALAPPPPPTASMRSPPAVAPAFHCRSQRRAVEPRPAPERFPVPLFGSAVTPSPPPTASMRSQGDGGGRALSQVGGPQRHDLVPQHAAQQPRHVPRASRSAAADTLGEPAGNLSPHFLSLPGNASSRVRSCLSRSTSLT